MTIRNVFLAICVIVTLVIVAVLVTTGLLEIFNWLTSLNWWLISGVTLALILLGILIDISCQYFVLGNKKWFTTICDHLLSVGKFIIKPTVYSKILIGLLVVTIVVSVLLGLRYWTTTIATGIETLQRHDMIVKQWEQKYGKLKNEHLLLKDNFDELHDDYVSLQNMTKFRLSVGGKGNF